MIREARQGPSRTCTWNSDRDSVAPRAREDELRIKLIHVPDDLAKMLLCTSVNSVAHLLIATWSCPDSMELRVRESLHPHDQRQMCLHRRRLHGRVVKWSDAHRTSDLQIHLRRLSYQVLNSG